MPTMADFELAWTNFDKPSKEFVAARNSEGSRQHPTQKPVTLAEWCFENFGNPKTVLDAFLGSGSTLIACEKTGRSCYGMELDPKYCDVILARWEKFTGKTAERAP
jgi:DNA modification methylase